MTALRRAVRVPLMVDTTDPEVMAAALELIPGRPVLNSVNLEDGGARLERVAALARRFGAVVVAGCIDEHPTDGMARTAERKAEVAARLLERLEAAGLRRREVLLDALVFPAATGDPKFRGSAGETVRGVKLIKERIPDALTVLGVSNVSFGVPAAGREVLNAVFLHHCVQAGLDGAIVNAEQLVRFPSLGAAEVQLAEDVLFDGDKRAVDAFVARYRQAPPRVASVDAHLSAEQRITLMVVEGTRTGLDATLDELLGRMGPLAIINGPLMAGMDEVGRLFGSGQLIVAEVLVSAEVMQAAVDHLKPHLKGDESAARGSILLATVRGDVHDIGKNLVGIILATNGYAVTDLGVQCPSDKLIAAWREHPTALIGLSGLLVRSAHQMAATAEDLRAAGIAAPLLVGGAALSASFTRDRIAPAYGATVRYAADAMAGLAIANELMREDGPEPCRRRDGCGPARRARQFGRLKTATSATRPKRRAAAIGPSPLTLACTPRTTGWTEHSSGRPTSRATCCASCRSTRCSPTSTRRCCSASTWGCAARCAACSTPATSAPSSSGAGSRRSRTLPPRGVGWRPPACTASSAPAPGATPWRSSTPPGGNWRRCRSCGKRGNRARAPRTGCRATRRRSTRSRSSWSPPAPACALAPPSFAPRGSCSTASRCRRWRSRPPRPPPSGCTAGCASSGGSPTRPR